jgi:hypothetical protein
MRGLEPRGVHTVVSVVILIVVTLLAGAAVVSYVRGIALPPKAPNTDIEFVLYDRGLPAKDRIMMDLISGDTIDFSKVKIVLENAQKRSEFMWATDLGPYTGDAVISPRGSRDHLKPGVKPTYYLENQITENNLPMGSRKVVTIGENRYGCTLSITIENRGGTVGLTIINVTGDEPYNIFVETGINPRAPENIYARFYDNIGWDKCFDLTAGDRVTVRLIYLPSGQIFFEKEIKVIAG